ncbi:MAG: diphosphatase [Anaerophaga sp.]|uniref:NUDIX hydrolase n=1 Tax=Anaerophaga thermohalophila TaxID=177400 RepID=UPI000237B8ED|nr:NUDIX domain-containing protein [Anaerophaga thermohalophila]MDI3521266.1 diphosphatase [Anaerophaga sp.]MDN5290355.1 diphosphatase [Anaerophaga sp.]
MARPEKVLKYCPSCGSGLFKPDSPKSFHCSSCGFKFFINSAAAVAAIIENDTGEILLTVRGVEPAVGALDLPGGFVDPMESGEEALKREVKEELNLDISEMHYLISYPNEYIYNGYSVFTTDYGYACKVKHFDSIKVADDIADFQFFNPKEIDFNKISSNSIKKILKFYIGGK